MFESRSICICGLPGIGSVGKVAADFLATALQCTTVKPFFSQRFPPQVMVSQGLTDLMHVELMKPLDLSNVLILSGDAQPLDVIGMYELAGDLLSAIKDEGVTDVITLAAYVGDTNEPVLGATTDAELSKTLVENRTPLLKSGAIGGLNGLLAGLAPRYGLTGTCLLATTSGADPVDIRAVTALLSRVKELLSLDIDVALLEPAIEQPIEQADKEADMNYR